MNHNPNPESELDQKSVKKEINRKIILLFTNQNDILIKMGENNKILMELLLYGDKENEE